MFRITKNATMQDKIVVSILLKHITIPTLSLPRVVKFCNAQRIGILKTKTRQKLHLPPCGFHVLPLLHGRGSL